MDILAKFVTQHLDDDPSRLVLNRSKYPEIDMDMAVNCIESRRKLKGKVQEWYDEPGLIFPLKLSAEQCSSSATGLYKSRLAEYIVKTSVLSKDDTKWTIADMTGGLGVDSWFFSKKAAMVLYNEMQEALCKAARHNFKVLGTDNIEIFNQKIEKGSCLDMLRSPGMTASVDIVYMDPARRGEGGKKVFLIEDCTPDVLTLKDEIFEEVRHILIKLSPMADITMVCERLGKHCREVHIVSTGGECKELLIWMDREWHEEYSIVAVELHPDSPSATFCFRPSEERRITFCEEASTVKAQRQVGGVDMPPPARGCLSEAKTGVNGTTCLGALYIFEPGKSLMKSGAFNLIAERFGIQKLGKSTHYYTTDSLETAETLKPYGKVYRIIECQPLDKRSIKETGKRYPKAEVTARNIPMDTDTLRKKLGVTSGDDAHIFGLKSDTEGNLLIAAQRIP